MMDDGNRDGEIECGMRMREVEDVGDNGTVRLVSTSELDQIDRPKESSA